MRLLEPAALADVVREVWTTDLLMQQARDIGMPARHVRVELAQEGERFDIAMLLYVGAGAYYGVDHLHSGRLRAASPAAIGHDLDRAIGRAMQFCWWAFVHDRGGYS